MTVLVSLAAALAGYMLAILVFPRLQLLDFPERYGLSRRRLPYPAGIVAVAVFLIWYGSTRTIGLQEAGVIGAVAVLAIVSFMDDRTPLPPLVRLGVQIAAALLVFAAGSRIYTLTSPLGGILKLDALTVNAGGFGVLPVWSGVFTVIWLLLTVNALNWFDGIPGQVSVISVIGFLMLGLLALLRNGEPATAEIAFALAGIALAGCIFDFPPAKVIMGDTGSMFFGFMLGLLGVYSGGKVATVFLALGLPLLDALLVILRRLSSGRSPLKGGQDHLHHLLLQRGWSERGVILLTVCIGTAFGTGALFMSTAQKGAAIGLLAMLVFGLSLYASAGRGSSAR
jgi:UDP-GlcNAc:undecaprenyl-phosphate/decaprenyl-phosphate GlcNAc-1-phosphate transferase